jgi:hypothetical protein
MWFEGLMMVENRKERKKPTTLSGKSVEETVQAAQERVDEKLADGKTQRKLELQWQALVREKHPKAPPEMFGPAEYENITRLVEYYGPVLAWDLMRFAVMVDWKDLMELDDFRCKRLQAVPTFHHLYSILNLVAARWTAERERQDKWLANEKRKVEERKQRERDRATVTPTSPGMLKMKEVIQTLEKKLRWDRAKGGEDLDKVEEV